MKDIIRMNQLAGIITENQAKKMMEILNESQEQLDRYKSDLDDGLYIPLEGELSPEKENKLIKAVGDYIEIKDNPYTGDPSIFVKFGGTYYKIINVLDKLKIPHNG